MKLLIKLLIIGLLNLVVAINAQANRYVLSDTGDTLLGEIITVKADESETLLDIARRHGFGYQDMKLINPGVDTWLPGGGMDVTLPSQFILPVAPQQGIVLNVPEMRLYYYPPVKNGEPREVFTFPLGVGREGWNTPYMKTKIIEKKVKPNWYPPESIRKEHEEKGDPLPRIVKAGPDNPLGDFAMRLGKPEYLIHGTNKPYGIGMRVSHGCIRLYPEDIEELFSQVSLKTPVNIINQPYKIGIRKNTIYLEVHPYLDEDAEQYDNNLTSVVALIIELAEDQKYELDWEAAYAAIKNPTGVPVAIGMFVSDVIQAGVDEELDQELPHNVMQTKVDERLNKKLTQAEKFNLQLKMDAEIKVSN